MTSNFNPLELLAERVTPLVVDHSQLEIDIDKKYHYLNSFTRLCWRYFINFLTD